MILVIFWPCSSPLAGFGGTSFAGPDPNALFSSSSSFTICLCNKQTPASRLQSSVYISTPLVDLHQSRHMVDSAFKIACCHRHTCRRALDFFSMSLIFSPPGPTTSFTFFSGTSITASGSGSSSESSKISSSFGILPSCAHAEQNPQGNVSPASAKYSSSCNRSLG